MKWIVPLVILTVGCSAHLVKSEGDLHTLGYRTGTLGTDWYDRQFHAGAEEICGKSYDVVERSKTPQTLKGAGNLIEKYDYYWTIKCTANQQ